MEDRKDKNEIELPEDARPLQVHIRLRDVEKELKALCQTVTESNTLLRDVSGSLKSYHAQTEKAIIRRVARHQKRCLERQAAAKVAEEKKDEFPWAKVLKGLFLGGAGLAVIVSGFLYEFGVLSSDKDDKPKVAISGPKEVKP